MRVESTMSGSRCHAQSNQSRTRQLKWAVGDDKQENASTRLVFTKGSTEGRQFLSEGLSAHVCVC
jgi:hypothetical protein